MGSLRSILFYILCSKNNISSRKELLVNLANAKHSHICVNNFNMVCYMSRKVKSYVQFSAHFLSYIIINIYVILVHVCIYFHTHLCHIYIK